MVFDIQQAAVVAPSMAAAIPAEDVRMQTPNWSTPEELSLGTGSTPQITSPTIPPMPGDEHNSVQEPENPDYNRGSSIGDISMSGSKSDSFRDTTHKQVKVLSFSLYLPVLVLHRSLSCACPSFFVRLPLHL